MKNLFRNQAIRVFTLIILFGMGITSCDSDNNDDPEPTTLDATLVATLDQYVDNVVVSTYKSLADESLKLQEATTDLSTDAKVETAASAWVAARKYWEQSEAFLFGAAADYNIDPHIDSWPLDKAALDNLLANAEVMESFDADYAGDKLGGGLLGFHAVEYVLFRDGSARKAADITANEAKYCAAVAEDLARQTIRLEAAWAGIDNVTSVKKAILEAAELEPTRNYGDELKAAGNTGNTLYPTLQAGIAETLTGAIGIADEVGNAKITDPVASGNVLDVESWYSWNSLVDFQNNIRSIQNAYLGGVEGSRDETKSVSAYVAKLNATLDTEIKTAITTAISEIAAIGEPFRNHLNEADTKDAIAACNTLMGKLEEAKTAVSGAAQ